MSIRSADSPSRPAPRWSFTRVAERTIQATATGATVTTCGTTPETRPSCTPPPDGGKTHVPGATAPVPSIADLLVTARPARRTARRGPFLVGGPAQPIT